MFLKFGIASNEIIMRIVLGKSENLQNKGYRRSTSNSGHTPSKYPMGNTTDEIDPDDELCRISIDMGVTRI